LSPSRQIATSPAPFDGTLEDHRLLAKLIGAGAFESIVVSR
jgi:hypothetical protein